MTTDRALLELHAVSRRYASLVAVDDVSLTVAVGERRAVIGPNGAGKTTLFDLISGRQRVSGGSILFAGRDITRTPEHVRARLGIATTFQRSALFEGLSALDNVAVAVQHRRRVAGNALRRADAFTDVADRSRQLLRQVLLGDHQRTRAAALSHGQRRQLEIAVALAIEPTLLLLDEPVAGMSPAESHAFVDMLDHLDADLTVLVIEHDMDVVFALASRITVLQAGRVLADGSPAEVRADPAVQEAYLGGGEAEELFRV
ncbi:MAG TPA: ABC transporter ATP-binding protein [Nitriliruptorales bacterium]|nr:ABC transporter ATP-binding protein [Nitriliruptorales bacterium]